MSIVFLGPPGAGKGTQAMMLENKEGFFTFSTGDALRSITSNSEEVNQIYSLQDKKLKNDITSILNEGKLVADNIIMDVVKNFLHNCENVSSIRKDKIIFDGIPRTKGQAESLGNILQDCDVPLTHVISFVLDSDVMLARLLARVQCGDCKELFSTSSLDREDISTNCPSCNSKNIIKRNDDNEDVIKMRYELYEENAKQIIEYYSHLSIPLLYLNAAQDVKDVSNDIITFLQDA